MITGRIRSPGYPSAPLGKCIEIIGKIYDKVRRNLVDREAIVKELGYSGLSGTSVKLLSDISHFGLLEKGRHSQIKVSELAVSILHPKDAQEKIDALEKAAYFPELFQKIHDEYPDGHVVDGQIKSFLKRLEFSETAIDLAVSSYRNTINYLEDAKISHGLPTFNDGNDNNPTLISPFNNNNGSSSQAKPLQSLELGTSIPISQGERVIFSEELTDGNYMKIVLKGEVDSLFIEALEDFVNRTKRRLNRLNKNDSPIDGSKDIIEDII